MYQCEHCSISFDKRQQKANHVRWNHKNPYTKKGKRQQKEKLEKAASKRYGSWIEEFVECPKCNTSFVRKRRDSDKGLKSAIKFCSRSCANSRSWTKEDKERKRIAALKNKKPLYVFKCKYCDKENQVPYKRRKKKFCTLSCASKYRYKRFNIKHNRADYRRAASFKFSLNDYPEKFNFDLIREYGWYSPSNSSNPNLNGVSRDHMISVQYGFENGIDPKIISHPANCRLILQTENFKKRNNCSITIEELIDRIDRW